MMRTVQRILVGALLLLSGLARAQTEDQIARARTHFEAGRALYNLGNYSDAIREFSAGYELVPKPQFLINLGQAYRKHGELEKARQMYRRFLESVPRNDPDREQVSQILADLEQQIAAEPPRPAAPPAVAPAPAHTEAALVAAPEPARKPWIRRNWWVIPVGAVVVGAALGVGLYFGLRGSTVDCSIATLGCIDTTAHP
jgi:tetratricopeptide (TPR) repeat protein